MSSAHCICTSAHFNDFLYQMTNYNKASLHCQILPTWNAKGLILLSMTSVRQNANINKTNNLPYIELRDTHRWELKNDLGFINLRYINLRFDDITNKYYSSFKSNRTYNGSLLSHSRPLNGFRLMTLPALDVEGLDPDDFWFPELPPGLCLPADAPLEVLVLEVMATAVEPNITLKDSK